MRSMIRVLGVVALWACLAVPTTAQQELSVDKVYLGGITLSQGSAAPSASEPNGSFYYRTNGQWYVRAGGAWVALTDTTGKLPDLSSATLSSLSAANLTNVPAGQLTGTITSSVQDNITRLGTIASAPGFAVNLLPSTSDTRDLGSPFKLWRQGYVSQMNATLFAKETQSLYGGWLSVSKNAGVLAASVSSADTTVDFGTAMTANQFVVIRAADNNTGVITAEFMKVGTLVSGTRYNVTRNLSGLGAKDWATGTPFMVRGVAGDGWIELNAFDTPRMSVFTQGSLYNNSTENLRIGHLTGMPNSSSGIGLYVGDASNYFRYDSSNLTLRSGGLNIDNVNGIAMTPNTIYDDTRSYRWTVNNGDMGLRGYYQPGSDRSIQIQSNPGVAETAEIGQVGLTTTAQGYSSAITMASGTSTGPTIKASISLVTGQFTLNGNYGGSELGNPLHIFASTPLKWEGQLSNFTLGLQERNRTFTMGEYVPIAYNAANFAANTGTWTVDSADQVTLGYSVVGKTLTLFFQIDNTDVSSATTGLLILLPAGYTCAARTQNIVQVADAGAAATTGVAFIPATGTAVEIRSNIGGGGWSATTGDNTLVRGQIAIPIQ
jgi:hypothetical protein